jgi:hypothetical protein
MLAVTVIRKYKINRKTTTEVNTRLLNKEIYEPIIKLINKKFWEERIAYFP